jgi:phosphatidylserine decarboxylase
MPMTSVAKNRSAVAREGLPWLLLCLASILIVYRFAGPAWSVLPAAALVALFLLFRDPGRDVPPLPLAVLAPCDGRVLSAEESATGELKGRWQCVRIRCSRIGAYTVRAPIEGQVQCLTEDQLAGSAERDGLWLRSEESDDVVLLFRGPPGPLAPRAFVRYGERLGQGQRFAYLRLAREARIYLPATARLKVSRGDRVTAGRSELAELARGDGG